MFEKSTESVERQIKLRNDQRKRDNGNTFGHESKDPCSKERELSIQCLELRRENESINCSDYFENFKTCKKFWNSVQEYRVKYMKKTRFDYPKGEEYEKWKNKLPEFLLSNKITPPDDI